MKRSGRRTGDPFRSDSRHISRDTRSGKRICRLQRWQQCQGLLRTQRRIHHSRELAGQDSPSGALHLDRSRRDRIGRGSGARLLQSSGPACRQSRKGHLHHGTRHQSHQSDILNHLTLPIEFKKARSSIRPRFFM